MQVNDPHGKLTAQEKRILLTQLIQNGLDNKRSNLSLAQLRIWLLQRMFPDAAFQVSAAYSVRGTLDVSALEQSVTEVARRHEIVRTTFADPDGQPIRIVKPSLAIKLSLHALRAPTEQEREAEAHEIAMQAATQPFAMNGDPLVRIVLVRGPEEVHTVHVTMHQLVADNWSIQRFVHELTSVYNAVLGSSLSPMPEAEGQYTDFVVRERAFLHGEHLHGHLGYWRQRLADLPVLEFPTSRSRPGELVVGTTSFHFDLPDDLVGGLERLGQQEGCPLFVTLLSAFQALLTWYSNQEDVPVNASFANPNWDRMIGPFAEVLALRADLSGGPTFRELLGRMRAVCEEALSHRGIPFERILQDLQQRERGQSPVFQIMFELLEMSASESVPVGHTWNPLALFTGHKPFELNLAVVRTSNGTRAVMQYSSELYDEGTIARMCGQYQALLERVLASPDQPLTELPWLTVAERHQIIQEWNDTAAPFPANRCLHELVEGQAGRSPDATAVVFGDTSLTYRQLNERTNQLARYLRGRGVGPDVPVAICVHRSLEMVVGILGVLKAGGAYVPVDPEYPAERIRFMLQDCRPQLLLTQGDLVDGWADQISEVLCLDRDWGEVALESSSDLDALATPDNLAYLIYTSGSTGMPKAVMVSHRSAVNNLWWRQQVLPLSDADAILQTWAFSFDPSVWAFFWPLIAGARVVLLRPGEQYDTKALSRLMVEHSITMFGGSPSLLSVLFEDPAMNACTALRCIQSGGEALTAELLSRIFARVRAAVWNAYGPTETTIDAATWMCPHGTRPQVVPIGRPLSNARIYILNDRLEPVPIGVVGEIYVGGVGLARGYYNRPDATADKFLPDPFGAQPGARLYRTGDLGRYRSDGMIEFLGRTDHQVKVRGYRIEPGEIESVLGADERVRQAVVRVWEDADGVKRLVAYVVPRGRVVLSRADLMPLLQRQLPDHMVPRFFVFLDELPMTPNGKLDRKALPAPDARAADSSGAPVAPRTPLEEEIAQTVVAIFGMSRLGIHDNLFDLGGNSLSMARLAARLSAMFGVNLPIHRLFQDPTVVGIATIIEAFQKQELGDLVKEWNLEQLEAEAELDPEITPAGLPVSATTNPSNIFITGATGYVGAFLLEQLLLETNADVYCLIRESNPGEGLERLKEIMQLYRIWDESFRSRLRPVPGDLSKPLLGLSREQFAALGATVDSIYHCGAVVKFTYPYSALKAPNVLGTHEILRLACTHKVKPVHYMSTFDVFLSATQLARPYREVDIDEIPLIGNRLEGYPLSKWVAEKIVSKARRRGVPVVVYRPGMMMGHGETGACHTTDHLLVFLKGMLRLGIMPETSAGMNVVPIDYAARAIFQISCRENAIGKNFHLWHTEEVPYMRAYDWVKSYGYQFDIVGAEALHERIAGIDSTNPLYPLVPLFFGEGQRGEDGSAPTEPAALTIFPANPELECLNTLKALEGSAVERPVIDERWAHRCFSYLIETGFLTPPGSQGGEQVGLAGHDHAAVSHSGGES